MIIPTKPEVGKVAMQIVDKMVKVIRAKEKIINQAFSTGNVIEWFKNIRDKKNLKFINWDIENFYASITPELVHQSLDWAMQ